MINRSRRRFLFALGGAATAAPLLRQSAAAQAGYPARPVRVIVASAPGGITDVVSRLVAGKLSERLGKQFYVENIVGGANNIGMGQAAKAAPDGYTMLAAYSNLVINPALFERLPFDPVKDFEPVSLAVTSTTVLVVNPGFAASTVAELIALVRANPGKYSYASAGAGTTSHLAGEQFRLVFGLDLVHVPFTGGSPAMAAVVAGHTPIGFAAPAASLELIRDARLRPLAVTSKMRTQTLPQVATITELGFPDIEGDGFVGFVVPAGTPRDIIAMLNREIVRSLAAADMKERQFTLGNDIVASTPEEFGQRITAELATWRKVVRAANIEVR
jgi:tripartite-type tricarboxylate transporter receptor subunit TctC